MGALVDGRRSLESAGFDMIESKFGNYDDEKKKGEGLRRLKKSRTCIPGYKQARAQALGKVIDSCRSGMLLVRALRGYVGDGQKSIECLS